MKNIKILLFTLFAYFSSNAQDPQLFENTWYLQNLIIDGQDNVPPSNEEVPFVDLIFSIVNSSIFLETNVCNNGNGIVNFNNSNSSFLFTEGFSTIIGECNDQNNSSFENLVFIIVFTKPFS